jgi:molybdate transport system substrate-binding protein
MIMANSFAWSRRFVVAAIWAAVFSLQPLVSLTHAQDREVVVFAAASLKNALDQVARDWSAKSGGKRVAISYAASSALARQIESGAPADIFVSADLDWMDYLDEMGLIQPDTRVNLLGNQLVLVAPKESTAKVELGLKLDLAAALGDGRLAMANVDSVPAGKYGKAALQKLGAWDGVKDRLAQAENVRAALQLVARGEAPLGIVYRTDATSDPRVKVIAAFPKDSHPPIIYPIAITRSSSNPAAKSLFEFVRSGAAKGAFDKQGFTVLNKPVPAS